MKSFEAYPFENKSFSIYLTLFIVIVFIALFANFLAPYNPYIGELKNAYMPPSSEHFFGTDKLGRDIFSRIIYGIRLSLSLSFVLVFLISFIGTFLGIISGYYQGIVDKIIMRIADVLISCPSMVLAIALAGIMGASIVNAMIAIFIVTISKYIRLARSLVIKVINEEYIKAAKVLGTKDRYIIFRHILPNIFQTLLVTASTDIGVMILELSALSFLGFGVPAPMPELGLMINEARAYMLKAPWLIFFPGMALFVILCVLNGLSDKLRDFLEK